jgi:hypothetical protein
MTTPATGPGGSDVNAELMTFSAAEFSHVPVLGYRLRESHRENADSVPYVPAPQRWMAVTTSKVIIDVPQFDRCKPFAQLLDDASTSEIVKSASAELAANWQDHQEAIAKLKPKPKGIAVAVRGNAFQALVWAHGALISAAGPVATALKLLIADFSLETRARLVLAQPSALEKALNVFQPDVRDHYIPDADEYVAQAYSEVSDVTKASQLKLGALAHKRKNKAPEPEDPPVHRPDGTDKSV